MNELRTLLEEVWVCKDNDKDRYYQIKNGIPRFQQFVREQLGWKLIHTEHLLKLEKIPAKAEPFMGIQEFTDIRDYCILCVVLMFLEDKEEQEQFLLSELIDFVEVHLKSRMEVDWTSFAQRKSLVRVLQYMESLSMIRVYEGSSAAFGQERGQEVLYENTGYSRYFATSFSYDISGLESSADFENARMEELESDRGHIRTNRVYRQLVTAPAMFWERSDDPDSLYLRNQRASVVKYLQEQLGGRLDIHKNMACWMVDEADVYGDVHPKDAMLPEIVLLVCSLIQPALLENKMSRDEQECIHLGRSDFEDLIWSCREKWSSGWSKEYREMLKDHLLRTIMDYMQAWMLIRIEGTDIVILPSVAKTAGFYPQDFRGETDE